MPEYLAPGVYVEETSFRSKSIEGVSTSTAGFVGPTRFGPTRGVPELVTSFADFQRIYGTMDQLDWKGSKAHNFLAHGVRTFFEEGGSRLYVARVFRQAGESSGIATLVLPEMTEDTDPGAAPEPGVLRLAARYPGAMGNMRVTFNLRLGQNILAATEQGMVLRGINNYDVIYLKTGADPGKFYLVEIMSDGDRKLFNLTEADGGEAAELNSLVDPAAVKEAKPNEGPQARVLTVSVATAVMGPGGVATNEQLWQGLSFHPAHANALSTLFPEEATSRATELYVPLVIKQPVGPLALVQMMLERKTPGGDKSLQDVLNEAMASTGELSDAALAFRVLLKGGNDGERPKPAEYEGDEGIGAGGKKSGLTVFKDIDEISIVAAPGATYDYTNYTAEANQILRSVISHCETMRYRVAILDSAENQLLSEVRAFRAQLDSTHSALYYPWLRVLDPVTGQQIHLPPSAFVAGIYARNDNQFGVHKAPANEVVRSALGLKVMLNKAQQDVLNPEGINCFRYFEGRGIRLWGARTISSDPEWKYVNVRRYFAYLEHTIDKGTQWVAFMNNDQNLWGNVRQTIDDFLYNEWKESRLMGATPAEAYFVRCDRSTMTQNDIDNGRLICLIGVSPVKPAEFVIFRIGQWTATQ